MPVNSLVSGTCLCPQQNIYLHHPNTSQVNTYQKKWSHFIELMSERGCLSHPTQLLVQRNYKLSEKKKGHAHESCPQYGSFLPHSIPVNSYQKNLLCHIYYTCVTAKTEMWLSCLLTKPQPSYWPA